MKIILLETHQGQENHLSFVGPLRLPLEGREMETLFCSEADNSYWCLSQKDGRQDAPIMTYFYTIFLDVPFTRQQFEFIYSHGLQ